MKYLTTFLLSLVFTINAYAATPQMSVGSYAEGGTLIKVTANGLVCDFCARAIEKVFMKQASVAGVNVDLGNHLILVSLKKGQTMDDATLTKLITDAGYNVADIARETATQAGE